MPHFFDLQYIGADIAVRIVNIIEFFPPKFFCYGEQAFESPVLVECPYFMDPFVYRQQGGHVLSGDPMNLGFRKMFADAANNSHALDDIANRTETDD